MNLTKKIYCVPGLFLLFTHYSIIGQTGKIAEAEKHLAKQYAILLNASANGNPDSVNYYSDKFSDGFLNLIRKNPTTVNYNFKTLTDSSYCDINTSADGNFRIYSWDTWTGGTMHNYQEIYQYKSGGHVFSKPSDYGEGEAGNYCSKIYTVMLDSKIFYLAVTNGVYSTKDRSQSIAVYTIGNNRLIDSVKLFKAKGKLMNRIDVAFDFFSVSDNGDNNLGLITYDERLKIIYIPVVNEKGTVTERNLLYQLKGKYFEFIGMEKGKRK